MVTSEKKSMVKRYLILFLSAGFIAVIVVIAMLKYTAGKQPQMVNKTESSQCGNADIHHNSSGQSMPAWVAKSRVGDSIEGGIIYVLLPPSDPTDTSWHRIVCAPSDQSAGATWNEAVGLCKSLSLNGYSDWQLPSSDQLQVMAENLESRGRGGLDNKDHSFKTYWSSTEIDSNYALNVSIVNSGVEQRVNKTRKFRVRAIRMF